jgi:hypothetical protein
MHAVGGAAPPPPAEKQPHHHGSDSSRGWSMCSVWRVVALVVLGGMVPAAAVF